MKIEKRLKLYAVDTEVWLPGNSEVLDLALDGKLLQLVVWEDAKAKTLCKKKFVWAVADEMCLLLDRQVAVYVGTIFDPELDENVYVFELK